VSQPLSRGGPSVSDAGDDRMIYWRTICATRSPAMSGGGHAAPPSAAPPPAGCLDVDLGFTPSTNLLAVRRLALSVGEERSTRAAWLRFPELRFEPLTQLYRREAEHLYRYESDGGRFVASLEVDGFGLVARYGDYWIAETAGAEAGGLR
jgi:hypothetical protein